MKTSAFRACSLLSFIALFLLFAPSAAFAHERRTIGGGKYDAVVGWDVEPAFQNQKNGASIRISQAGSNPAVPVTGAEKTLKVQIKQGATTREYPLRAVFGQQGYYVADLLPVRDGEFQWTFTGAIDGTPINDTFDTADGKFNKVESTAGIAFPAPAADASQAIAAAQTAQAEAQTARLLGLAGIVVGILGLAAAVLAMRGRSAAARVPAASRPLADRV